ncbi:hypothetical protein [Streptomyces sp. NPDC048242]|uniref:hypothetical protein n=1 Tax=Streptomyces sp. NPDC048242 TaxID=3155026 RepID=UPI003445CAB4
MTAWDASEFIRPEPKRRPSSVPVGFRPLNARAPSLRTENDEGLYAALSEQAAKDIAERTRRKEAEEQRAAEGAEIAREGAALADRIANRFSF